MKTILVTAKLKVTRKEVQGTVRRRQSRVIRVQVWAKVKTFIVVCCSLPTGSWKQRLLSNNLSIVVLAIIKGRKLISWIYFILSKVSMFKIHSISWTKKRNVSFLRCHKQRWLTNEFQRAEFFRSTIDQSRVSQQYYLTNRCTDRCASLIVFKNRGRAVTGMNNE